MQRRRQLEAKRKRLRSALPTLEHVLRASLFQRSRRCGKPGCHCAEGEGHPTFYLSVSFAGGWSSPAFLDSLLSGARSLTCEVCDAAAPRDARHERAATVSSLVPLHRDA
jgi:hypothetical protein